MQHLTEDQFLLLSIALEVDIRLTRQVPHRLKWRQLRIEKNFYVQGQLKNDQSTIDELFALNYITSFSRGPGVKLSPYEVTLQGELAFTLEFHRRMLPNDDYRKVWDVLQDGQGFAQSTHHISVRCGIDRARVYRILRALTTYGHAESVRGVWWPKKYIAA